MKEEIKIISKHVPDSIDYESFEGMSIQQAAAAQQDIKDAFDAAGAIKSHFQKIYDHLRLTRIPEIMDGDGINTITLKDIGRVTLTSDIYASIPADKKDESWDWLRDNDHGGIIKETINAGTLKATLKSIIKKGEILPEGLFKVTPFSRASITKIK